MEAKMTATGQTFIQSTTGEPSTTFTPVSNTDLAVEQLAPFAQQHGNDTFGQVLEGAIASIPSGGTVATTVYVYNPNDGGVSGGDAKITNVTAATVITQTALDGLNNVFRHPQTENPVLDVNSPGFNYTAPAI